MLTLSLLLSLGEDSKGQKVLLGVVAIALEGAKILSWRAGGKSRLLAIVLIFLSAIASLGASLQAVENAKDSLFSVSVEEVRSRPEYHALKSEISSIDSEIGILLNRLKDMPVDYPTASARITDSLSSLRDRREDVLSSIASLEATVGTSSINVGMMTLLGRTIGVRPETLMLILLLFLSGCIEAGALNLTAPDSRRDASSRFAVDASKSQRTEEITPNRDRTVLQPSYPPPITSEQFLEAAKRKANLPYLNGRDRTAEALGISYAEAKRHIARLMQDGKVVAEGKRLRLATSP